VSLTQVTVDSERDTPLLGMTFLQAAYLHVNYDQGAFTIWQANPTSEENFVAVANSTSTCPTNTSDASVASNTAVAKSSNGISGGAIGGIVIGVVSAIILAITIFFLRWQRKRRSAEAISYAMGGAVSTSPPPHTD
jgi:hypothetical protein